MSRSVRSQRQGPAAAIVSGGVAVLALALSACSGSPSQPAASSERVSGGPTGHYVVTAGIHKIKHVIVIEQENRSFDNYFGTYPGADGIPMKAANRQSASRYRAEGARRRTTTRRTSTVAGRTARRTPWPDVDGGKMDGFIEEATDAKKGCGANCNTVDDPAVLQLGHTRRHGATTRRRRSRTTGPTPGLHPRRPHVRAGRVVRLPDHLYLVSGWSAKCSSPAPIELRERDVGPGNGGADGEYGTRRSTPGRRRHHAWTDVTWLLTANTSSGPTSSRPGTSRTARTTGGGLPPVAQHYLTPGIWNPLPVFEDVQKDHQIAQHRPHEQVLRMIGQGGQPASVIWVTPSQADSEHPPASVHQGQAYVTSVINAVMQSPYWDSTVIFLTWDDWGGFYDQSCPPRSTRTATACGCLRWSSRPTPRPGTSTTRLSQRRLPEVHRGRLPGRGQAQPEDRRPTRPQARRPRGRGDPGRHGQRLRLQPDSTKPRFCFRPIRQRTRQASRPTSMAWDRAWDARRAPQHLSFHPSTSDPVSPAGSLYLRTFSLHSRCRVACCRWRDRPIETVFETTVVPKIWSFGGAHRHRVSVR